MAGIGKEILFLIWILKLKSLVPEHSNHRENLLIKGVFLQLFFYPKSFNAILEKFYIQYIYIQLSILVNQL